MEPVKSVTVYCGSSNNAPEVYQKAAVDLGALFAKNRIQLVYGGGRMGLMGTISESALKNGGRVIGYMTTFLSEFELGHEEITELHIVESMHERKQKMFERSDAFVILPGGLGTLDELFEIMTWKQVGLHRKKIIIVDVNNYWSPLFVDFLNLMISDTFVREEDKKLYTLVKTVDEVLPALHNGSAFDQDFVAKWG